MIKIAIQGIRGAFHEVAARRFYGNEAAIVPALTFQELFQITEAGRQCDAAIVAIENSLAGSILGNYKLLKNSSLTIVGEVLLPIGQHLMALPGVRLEDLTEVHSHPMALAQCELFLRRYPHLRLVEADDTAASAERIQRNQTRHIAAIASDLAAEIYGLEIIAPNIEDDQSNTTRFLALVPPEMSSKYATSTPNKASICFVTPHKPGALSYVLGMMAYHGANLTKIQSLPVEGKIWEYRFFVDYIFEQETDHQRILKNLTDNVTDLQILGTYAASL